MTNKNTSSFSTVKSITLSLRTSRPLRITQIAFAAAALVLLFANPAKAFTYDKNNIITDGEMTNSSYMTKTGVQDFLKAKGSVLAGYKTQNVSGETRTFAEIVVETAKKYKLNPMLFLVMAQKESGAITRSGSLTYSIEHWILGYGRCDSCSEEQAAKYRGVAKQLDSAGKQFREGYLADLDRRGYTISGWGVGRTKTTADGIAVTPSNKATAALYTYNPWVGAYGGGDRRYGANSLFAKLWREWNPDYKYPDGSLIQIGSTVYLIEDGKKRAFTSKGAVAANYDTRRIVSVPSTVGSLYKNGRPVTYPNYSILKSPEGRTYLIVDGERRMFQNSRALKSAGFKMDEIIKATKKDIAVFETGKMIKAGSLYPTGAIIKSAKTGNISWVAPNAAYRRKIESHEILINRFSDNQTVQVVSHEDYMAIKAKPALKLANGTLMASPGYKSVYLIDGGERRAIDSKNTFDALGYHWDDIVWVDSSVVRLHPVGSMVKITKASKSKKQTTSTSKTAAKASPTLPYKNGRLLASATDKSVYLIKDGKRRPFDSKNTFDSMGYQWNDIVWVEQKTLDLYPKGSYLKSTN